MSPQVTLKVAFVGKIERLKAAVAAGRVPPELKEIWPKGTAEIKMAFAADWGWDDPCPGNPSQTLRKLAEDKGMMVFQRTGLEYGVDY